MVKLDFVIFFSYNRHMKSIDQNEIITKFSNLKVYQQKKIVDFLNIFFSINIIDTGLITKEQMICENCGSSFFIKNGTYQRIVENKLVQRYQCKNCKNTQFSDINTPLYNLKQRGKWADFVYIMIDNKSPTDLISIAELLDISESTALRWRHKLLSSLNQSKPLLIEDELEIDEVYFPFTVKGTLGKEKFDEYFGPSNNENIETELRKKEKLMEKEKYQVIFLCRHNRIGDFDFSPIKIQKKGIVSEADLKKVMEHLDMSNKTIITDKEPSLIAYFKNEKSVNHLTFRSSDIKKGILENANVHNNNINGMMSQLRNWFKNFHGVSTKYLENYLKWFRFSNIFKSHKFKKIVEYCLLDNESYPRFKNLFKTYEEFVYI